MSDHEEQPTKKRKNISKIKKREKERENKLCAIAIKQLIKPVKKPKQQKQREMGYSLIFPCVSLLWLFFFP